MTFTHVLGPALVNIAASGGVFLLLASIYPDVYSSLDAWEQGWPSGFPSLISLTCLPGLIFSSWRFLRGIKNDAENN